MFQLLLEEYNFVSS